MKTTSTKLFWRYGALLTVGGSGISQKEARGTARGEVNIVVVKAQIHAGGRGKVGRDGAFGR